MSGEELEIVRNLQSVIKKNMRELEEGDVFYSPTDDKIHAHNAKNIVLDSDIWIPDAVSRDSARPQRGLLGMIKDFRSILYYGDQHEAFQVTLFEHCSYVFRAKTLYLALLFTLRYQTQQTIND